MAVIDRDIGTWASVADNDAQFEKALNDATLCVFVLSAADVSRHGGRNLVYEAGYLFGRLGPSRLALVLDVESRDIPKNLREAETFLYDTSTLKQDIAEISEHLAHRLQTRRREATRDRRPWLTTRRVALPSEAATLSVVAAGLVALATLAVSERTALRYTVVGSAGVLALALYIVFLTQRQSAAAAAARLEALRAETSSQLERQRAMIATSLARISTFSSPLQQPTGFTRELSGVVDESDDREELTALLGEVTHALGTPLGQIRAASNTLIRRNADSDDHELLVGISESIHLCNAILSSFRHVLAAVPMSSEGYVSLSDALERLARLYDATAATSGVHVEIDVSGSDSGYPSEYLLALLLPLIENGVEAAEADTSICVRDRRTRTSLVFEVLSTPRELPAATDDIYDAGVTTKPGHDGLGLATVRRLLSVYRKAHLSHLVSDLQVKFVIELPLRSQ